MSLILEALRKSEAERRRGEAPGLRVELPPAATAARRSLPGWTWIAGAALVLVLLLVALWTGGSGVGDGGGGLGNDGADLIAAPVDGGPPQDDGAPATAAPAPAQSPATTSTRMPTVGDPDAFPQVDRIAPREPASRMPPPPEDGSGSETAPAPAPASTQAEAPATAPAPARATEAGPAEAARPALSPATDVPRITQLTAAQRQRLPAMKLTMHMWNEDPARRFVVIDGQRKAEGDRVGEAGIIAIDRDGILLELDGRPVRVPLP